ncbi:hypothetical protein EUX57_15970 [Pseudomonas orientalis]|uniref:Uncharacterized protein n=1 Tax=Pseudomonas orientalis TaxID=76758 RepID=A0A4Q7CWR6_9PSED|nr:hypothetical protein EUX57_15970 [Pseudomonas orientalis]
MCFCVGASLLAKNLRAPRSSRMNALSLTFFASKLAPTGFIRQSECKVFQGHQRLWPASHRPGGDPRGSRRW